LIFDRKEKTMEETVLVTGGAGFIGSHVSQELINLGYKVVILDDLSGGFKDNVPDGAELVVASILDYAKITELFQKHQFSYVFHLAAYAAEGLSHFIKRFNYNNNLIGSINLINAAVNFNVKCFVFTSSIAVYGKGQLPMVEEMMPMPEDSYGIAKFAIEQELRASHEMFGLNYVIFRPHNVYGEHQNIGDTYRNVIGIFMNQIMQGKPLTIFGDGQQTRAFTYISDVAPIIARSIKVPGAYNQVFNVGADQPYTVNYVAKVVADAMEKDLQINYLDPRNEVQHAFSNHDKVRKTFGVSEGISLEEGVLRMAKWAMQIGARQSNIFKEIEIEKNLPPSWRLRIKENS
jgi:UDP-glucose 4-epimerase